MKVIVSVTNDIVTDQRVARSCQVMERLGYEVLLVGRKLRHSTAIDRSYRTKRMRLLFNKKVFFYAEYNIRLFFLLLFNKVDILFANDLDTLLPNVLVARIKGIPIVYDSHEYFTGMPELVGRNIVKATWQKIERFCIPKVDQMITVNDSIANMYISEYKRDVKVIRNISSQKKYEELNGECKTNIDTPYIIYQGAINIQRGLEETIAAMEYIEGYKFVIAGDGDILAELKERVSKLNYNDKIIFTGRLSPAELAKYTKNASLGISPELDSCINYRYCLPNKLFDYINAHIPVLVSNLSEMKSLVTRYKLGEVIESHEPQSLANQINNMLCNRHRLNEYITNAKAASKELCWEVESKILDRIMLQVCKPATDIDKKI